jgi:hypothetical protein
MPNYLARVALAGARAGSPARPAFAGPPRLPDAAGRPPAADTMEATFALPEEQAGTGATPTFPTAANADSPPAEGNAPERGIGSESAPSPARAIRRAAGPMEASVAPPAPGEPSPQTQARPAGPTAPPPEQSARGRRPGARATQDSEGAAAQESAVSGPTAGERASLLRAEAGRVDAGPLFEMPKTLPPRSNTPASEPGAARETGWKQESLAAVPRTAGVLPTGRAEGQPPDSRTASFGTVAAASPPDRAFARERTAASAPPPGAPDAEPERRSLALLPPGAQRAAAEPRFPPGEPPQARPAAPTRLAEPPGSAGGGAGGRQTRITIGRLDVQVHNRPPQPPSRPPTPAGPSPGDILERRFLDRFRLRP